MGRTANTTKTETEETKDIKVTDNFTEENNQLKTEMAEMKAQMELLMKQMSTMSQPVAQLQTAVVSGSVEKDIEVVSLHEGGLLLTTNGKGDGFHYEFEKQFDTVLIPESDLKLIVRSMPKTTREGYFYILDEDFVKSMKLTTAYQKILDRDCLTGLLNKPVNEFLAAYNQAPNAQKAIIQGIVYNKKLAGEYVDANILIELGKLCKRDFMAIEPLETEG